MEDDMRDAFKDLKKDMKENIKDLKDETLLGIGRVEGEVTSLRTAFQTHEVVSATRSQAIKDQAKSAHNRLDDMQNGVKASRAMSWQVWLAIGMLGAGSISSLLFWLLTKGAAS